MEWEAVVLIVVGVLLIVAGLSDLIDWATKWRN